MVIERFLVGLNFQIIQMWDLLECEETQKERHWKNKVVDGVKVSWQQLQLQHIDLAFDIDVLQSFADIDDKMD